MDMTGTERERHVQRGLVFVVALTVVVGIAIVALDRSRAREVVTPELTARPLTTDDHILGSIDAPMQLIVYTDLECPYCKRFHQQTLPRLIKTYGDEIVIAYRHNPMPSRPQGLPEAEAAECAHLLGGHEVFWGFMTRVFAITPSNDGLDLALLPAIAAELGLNREEFQQCQSERRGSSRVSADVIDAALVGVRVTPSILVQGKGRSELVAGDYFNRLAATIDYIRAVE